MANKEIILFQHLANETWNRLKVAHELDISFSEETVTDINLLDIKKSFNSNIFIRKSNKQTEGDKGFDWEFWIGNNSYGWDRYSIQAKIISTDRFSYKSLRHPVNGKFQIDILKDFSKNNRTIPLYCFYNFLDHSNLQDYWNCRLSFNKQNLGCTLVPLEIVEIYHQKNESKKFKDIHDHDSAKPWHCLFCPTIQIDSGGDNLPLTINPFDPSDWQPVRYKKLPEFLSGESDSKTIELDDEYYRSEYGGYPEWIAVIENE